MSSDSDIALAFKALKEDRKEKKKNRLEGACSKGWDKHTPYHWSRFVDGKKMDYWPSTGTVMYKGKRTSISSKKVQKLIGEVENVSI